MIPQVFKVTGIQVQQEENNTEITQQIIFYADTQQEYPDALCRVENNPLQQMYLPQVLPFLPGAAVTKNRNQPAGNNEQQPATVPGNIFDERGASAVPMPATPARHLIMPYGRAGSCPGTGRHHL